MSRMAPALLILVYCLWNSRELLGAWTTRVEAYGWLFFIVWLAPLIAYRLTAGLRGLPQLPLLLAGLFISLLGVIGVMNTLCYIGLAFALSAFFPATWAVAPWFAASVVWMPAFGWISLQYPWAPDFIIRIVIAALSSLWMFIYLARSGGLHVK